MSIGRFGYQEAFRLDSLRDLDILDTPAEEQFDTVAQLAAAVCETPIALISLVDSNRQWFKAQVGLPGVTETPRDVSFCSHAIRQEDVFEIKEATLDPRFADNPLVTGEPFIRFYAGAPLTLKDGSRIGTVCVIDTVPKKLSDTQREALEDLARLTVSALEARRALAEESKLRQALIAAEARTRLLSDRSPLGVYATDAEGKCTYTNARWQNIFDMGESESLGDGWATTLHPEDKDQVFRAWQRTTAQRREFSMEFRIQQRDGSVRYVRSHAAGIEDINGKVTGYVGTLEDITGQHYALTELARERQRLANILEGTGAGTWEWNIASDELHLNHTSMQLVGHDIANPPSKSMTQWRTFIHPEDLERVKSVFAEHLAGKREFYEAQFRLRHKKGHWVWVRSRGRVLSRTPSGEPEWMFGTHMQAESMDRQR